jgi:tetratricopeptide (TPR) repeat protein
MNVGVEKVTGGATSRGLLALRSQDQPRPAGRLLQGSGPAARVGRRWFLTLAILWLGCAGAAAPAVAEKGAGASAATAAKPLPLRRVQPEAYGAFAKAVVLEMRVRRLLIEAQQLRFNDRELSAQKRQEAAEVWVQAREAFQRAIDRDPEGVVPVRELAFALVARGDSEEAIPHFERTLQLAPDDFEARLTLALLYERAERFADARGAYRQLIEQVPGNQAVGILPELYVHLATVTERADGPASGLAVFVEALTTCPDAAAVRVGAEQAIERTRTDEGVADKLEKAVPAKGRGFAYSYVLGRMAFVRQDWRRAATELERSIAAKADFWPAYLYRCLAMSEVGQVEEALAVLVKAPQQQMEPGTADFLRGSILLRGRRYEEARQELEHAVQVAPANLLARYELAGVYEKLGLLDEAIQALRVNLGLKPDHADSLNALGYFLALKDAELGEAEKLVRKALEQEPDNGAYLDSLGWVLFKEGKVDDALAMLTKAADKLADPVVYDHLGDVYRQRGDVEEAARWWQRALKLDTKADAVREKLKAVRREGSSPAGE